MGGEQRAMRLRLGRERSFACKEIAVEVVTWEGREVEEEQTEKTGGEGVAVM